MVHMIALIRVNSLVDFESYRAKVPATLEPYGGEVQFRAKKIITFVDENELGDLTQIALLRFPSQDNMNDWYASDAYQNLSKLRTSAGSFTMLGLNP